MSFHTIDPLIIQTLNLNEKRMNHILDILHGKNVQKINNTKRLNQQPKKYSFENSLRQKTKNYSTLLPQINRRNQTKLTKKNGQSRQQNENKLQTQTRRKAISLKQRQRRFTTIEQHSNKLRRNTKNNDSKLQHNTTIDDYITPISLRTNQTYINQNSKNALSALRSKYNVHKRNTQFQSPSLTDLSLRVNIYEEQIKNEDTQSARRGYLKLKQQNSRKGSVKKSQIINDYIHEMGLKKSKSAMLHSKDVYRLQIQKIVAQLTPIEIIAQAQKKMKRIKKRYQNLKSFDQKYYSRLNEMDLVLL